MASLVPVDFDPFASDQSSNADAISSIESGGNYRSVGPLILHGSMRGQRALGKYQVMESNIGPWTEEALGQRLTPMQFLASPEAQDKTFQFKFGQYEKKYGPEGAARAWFAGEGGMNDPNRRDQLGTSVAQYGQRFNNALSAKSKPQGGPQLVPVDFDPFAQKPPIETLSSRFNAVSSGERPDMQTALSGRATEMMRGPATSPVQNMDITESNVLPAATQGTSPNVSDYGGKLVSKETFQSDSGEILYRDPATGEVKPTDSKTQVAIRDPADNTVKIFERSEATNENPAVGVSRVLAPGLAAGAPAARPAVAAAPKAGLVKASDIMATAKAPYKTFDALAPQSAQVGTADTAQRIAKALEEGKQPTTFAGPKAIQTEVERLADQGDYVTVDKLRDLKERLGSSFKSADGRERAAAAIASREISKIISEAAPEAGAALNKADKIFSTAKSVQELQRAQDIAGLRAGRTGYGGNAVNTMRQEIGRILDRIVKGAKTNFTPDEISAMREIDQGTPTTNTLRLVGQASPTKGFMQAGGEAYAATVHGPAALAVPAIGMASNKLATILTGRQIDRLRDLVAKRSPAYAEAVSRAVRKWETAQAELGSNPSPAKFAAYVSASRALSAGLTRDGIQVSSGDLIKQLAAPIKSAADEENPGDGAGP